MKAYKVKEGKATELNSTNKIYAFSKRCNWEGEALIIAESKEEALELANLCDDGKIDRDNFFYPDSYGQACVFFLTIYEGEHTEGNFKIKYDLERKRLLYEDSEKTSPLIETKLKIRIKAHSYLREFLKKIIGIQK